MFWRKKLLCQFDRNNVLDFLRKEDGYSLDKVLCVTKEYAILDATAYLLVRTGNVTEAVNLLVLDMAESMSETKLSALVDLISSIDDEKQWFIVLDALIAQKQTNSSNPLANKLIHKLLESMKSNVNLKSVLLHLTDNGSGEKETLGAFRTTINSMLGNITYEKEVLKSVKKLQVETTYKSIQSRHKLRCGAATDVDIWDSTILLDDDNSKIAGSIEFGKRRQRKMMKRYKAKISTRHRRFLSSYFRINKENTNRSGDKPVGIIRSSNLLFSSVI